MKDDGLPPTDDDGWGEIAPKREVVDEEPKVVVDLETEEPELAKEISGEAEVADERPRAAAKVMAESPAPPEVGKHGHAAGKHGPAPAPAPQKPVAAAAPQRAPKKPSEATSTPRPATAESKSSQTATLATKPTASHTTKPAADHTAKPAADHVAKPAADHTAKPASKPVPAATRTPAKAGPTPAKPGPAPTKPGPTPAKPGPAPTKPAGATKATPKKERKKLFGRSDKGGSPPPRDGDGSPPAGSRPRRFRWLVATCALAALTTLAVVSTLNHRNYYFVCHPDSITAERGSLWPWGQAKLDGPSWKAIPIDAEYNCKSRELDDQGDLAETFAETLIEVTDNLLSRSDADANVEVMSAQLDQALLLTRGDRARRERVDRLRGDVHHQKGKRAVMSARNALEQAREQFDAAALKRPIHSNDSGSWSQFAAQLLSEIDKGPHDLRPEQEQRAQPPIAPTQPPGPRPEVPPTQPPPTSEPGPKDAGPLAPPKPPPARGGVLL